ncbi:MAG: hypothetical protein DWQ07_04440 [Chloroflexi bacterium]|nr:MAG: hypothetical protein DWQ07_04440 [Chloroflexota bacterium]MBL1194682.1 hypothetical protein [Chloroflexota bacterium]NOH11973.1 hypothetical protein [Chloroflexota bacterium]
MNSSTGRTILIIVIVGVVIAAACLCVSLLGFGGLVSYGLQEPENLDISVDVPVTAQIDEEVTLTVSVYNSGNESQTLDSIDWPRSYLDGIVIRNVSPGAIDETDFDLFGLEFVSYAFNRLISPGETIEVDFTAVPVKAGDFSGELDVCINSGGVCQTLVVRTVVDN